jgi:hypothetical protein
VPIPQCAQTLHGFIEQSHFPAIRPRLYPRKPSLYRFVCAAQKLRNFRWIGFLDSCVTCFLPFVQVPTARCRFFLFVGRHGRILLPPRRAVHRRHAVPLFAKCRSLWKSARCRAPAALAEMQSRANLRHDFFRLMTHIDDQRIRRLLERRQLARQQGFPGKMSMPLVKVRTQHRL